MKKFALLYNILPVLCFFSGMNMSAQNWQQVNSNTTNEILDMYFSSPTLGFSIAANGQVLKTTDAGNNWNILINSTEIYSDASIVTTADSVFCYGKDFFGIDKKVSFAVNSAIPVTGTTIGTVSHPLYHNGQIWNLETVNSLVATTYPDIYADRFSIYNNIISCSDALYIYYSSDNGLSWQRKQYSDTMLSSYPYQAFSSDSQKLIAISQYPTVQHISYNEGVTWQHHELPTQYFYFINPGMALGISLTDTILYYSENDGTLTGTEVLPLPVKNAYSYSDNLVFVFGENGVIYKTTTIEDALKTGNFSPEIQITLYPNPANGAITIDYDANQITINNITLLDQTGKIIHESSGTSSHNLNFPALASGLYYLQLNTNKGMCNKKVILN